ncbi:MAG: glycosyltransferase [Candidatus Peribacteraceae bacterium]|nr:glycosyltransferase [Candidatus Peribacteraceae bacterium]
MKLLVVTQAADLDHPILGFFHRWLEEFVAQGTELTVIAQQVGRTTVDATILSLNKEKGAGKAAQILRFWRLIITQRKDYDAVLVHMTPIWVVLGWPVWMVLGKRVFLWYEVRRGGRLLKLAERLCTRIYSATPEGMPWPSSKQEVVGHGIDTQQFAPAGARDKNLCATVGRVTPIKHLPQVVEAFAALPSSMKLRIVGDAFTDADRREKEAVLALADRLGARDRIEMGFLPHHELPALLARTTLFLHASRGGLDKALLEAMACGCLVVTTSEAAAMLLPEACRADPNTLGGIALALLTLSEPEHEALSAELRRIVVERHGLPRLVTALLLSMARG